MSKTPRGRCFAQDATDFSNKIAHWPLDVQTHLAWLSRNAFAA
ncbi:hypothetical protein ACQ9Y2_11155 [Pseudomonas palleroniana]